MRKYIIILLTINNFYLKAQVNLVPNPSFEDTIPCNTSGVPPVAFWGLGGGGHLIILTKL